MLGLLHAGSWVRVHGHPLPLPKIQESGQRQRGGRKGCRRTPGTEATATEVVRKERAGVERTPAQHHPKP